MANLHCIEITKFLVDDTEKAAVTILPEPNGIASSSRHLTYAALIVPIYQH
jgi:hypothetical protein